MHTFSPPKQGKLHITLPVLFFLMSFLCVAAVKLGDIIPDFIMQFICVAFGALAVQLITRYSLTRFIYEINEEGSVLSIRKIIGKKSTLAGAIEFSDIVCIDKKEKGYSPKKLHKKSFKSFNFCNNIYPQNAYCLILDINGDNTAVYIEADKAFLEIIDHQRNKHSKGENK